MATGDVMVRYMDPQPTARAWVMAARRFTVWRAARARRAALRELLEFDDERLRDIGLTRDDLRRAKDG